jgi:hypothetical protein
MPSAAFFMPTISQKRLVVGRPSGRLSMRLALIATFALCNMLVPLAAEEAADSLAAASVLSAGADPDGKGYVISLSLENGRQVSIRVPPAEALKIVEGLSKAVTSGPQGQQQVVAVVKSINITADERGRVVVLTPHIRTGPLEPFAIPISGAAQFVQLFQQKAAETKANAAKNR